jgi:hypothetical protein
MDTAGKVEAAINNFRQSQNKKRDGKCAAPVFVGPIRTSSLNAPIVLVSLLFYRKIVILS